MHFMSRKKNMKKSNDRHDKLLCIMMHGSLAFGKRYGIIMYNVELSRLSGRFLREIRGFQLPPCCLMATGSYPRIIQCAAMAVGQEVFLVSPVQAVRTLLQLLPQAEFWQRVGFSSGRILLGFGLGVAVSIVLAVAAQAWHTADVLLAPVLQLVKATPVASFIILALVWVSGKSLSILISFLMVLPVLYGAVRTGIQSADPQLLEMTKVFRLPLGRRLRAVWLPAVLPAFRQGCSVALGICWKSGVAAEVIGLPNGSIGDALYRAKITLSTGELFAWTFVIILLSAGFEKLFLLLLDCVTRAVTG